jgi:Protein of unknown function (DUF3096)
MLKSGEVVLVSLPRNAAKAIRYRRSGRGLKEAAQTLYSSNVLFSPSFQAWDNTCLMHYAGWTNRADLCPAHNGGTMSFDVQMVNPLMALVAVILIFLMPRLLNYVVIYP